MTFQLTSDSLRRLCREQNLYSHAPELNDVLYLQLKGITKLENLQEYTGVKTLYLESNAISVIENIDHMQELRCLYLGKNMISSINHLNNLQMLGTLDLSYNCIEILENLSCLPSLTTLNVAHNKLATLSSIIHLKDCQNLSSLDLSHNKFEAQDVVEFLCSLPLLLLCLSGNPVVSNMRHYRKYILSNMPGLQSLDALPCFEKDRRLAVAFSEGGLDMEKEVRAQIKQEEVDAAERNRLAFQEMVRKAKEDAIKNPQPPPDPMRFRAVPVGESDDEDDNSLHSATKKATSDGPASSSKPVTIASAHMRKADGAQTDVMPGPPDQQSVITDELTSTNTPTTDVVSDNIDLHGHDSGSSSPSESQTQPALQDNADMGVPIPDSTSIIIPASTPGQMQLCQQQYTPISESQVTAPSSNTAKILPSSLPSHTTLPWTTEPESTSAGTTSLGGFHPQASVQQALVSNNTAPVVRGPYLEELMHGKLQQQQQKEQQQQQVGSSTPALPQPPFHEELLARSSARMVTGSESRPLTAAPSSASPSSGRRRPIVWGTAQYQDLWQKACSMPDPPSTDASDDASDDDPTPTPSRNSTFEQPSSPSQPASSLTTAFTSSNSSEVLTPLDAAHTRAHTNTHPSSSPPVDAHPLSTNDVQVDVSESPLRPQTADGTSAEEMPSGSHFRVPTPSTSLDRPPSDLVSLADSAMNRDERLDEMLSIPDSAMNYVIDTPHAYEAARRGGADPSSRLEFDSAYDSNSDVSDSHASESSADPFERYTVTGYGRGPVNPQHPDPALQMQAVTSSGEHPGVEPAMSDATEGAAGGSSSAGAAAQHDSDRVLRNSQLLGREDSARFLNGHMRHASMLAEEEPQRRPPSSLLEQARNVVAPDGVINSAAAGALSVDAHAMRFGPHQPDLAHPAAGVNMGLLARARAVVMGQCRDSAPSSSAAGPSSSYRMHSSSASCQDLYDLD